MLKLQSEAYPKEVGANVEQVNQTSIRRKISTLRLYICLNIHLSGGHSRPFVLGLVVHPEH
jgi:hypothetical protein